MNGPGAPRPLNRCASNDPARHECHLGGHAAQAIGTLALGRRKDKPTPAVNGLLELFEERTLPFDTRAAHCYADLAIEARAAGRGFPTPDGYIAAIAASREFAVASRDTSAFAAADLSVIDPWAPAT